jgi:hypothetical protein
MKDSQPNNPIIIYTGGERHADIEVRLQGDTAWLSQTQLVELYQSSKANVSEHIKNIYNEGELSPQATVRKFRTVQKEGNREVYRDIEHYNLDMIISLGYRVKSSIATKFRIWATDRLREYIIKGFTIDSDKPFAGLTNFKGKQPTQAEAMIAKNYLDIKELKVLNNLVSAYFDIAEVNAIEQKPMRMTDYIRELDMILKSTNRKLLDNAGGVSHKQAQRVIANIRV